MALDSLNEGEVVDVPFLQAPGFIQAFTVDHQSYPDVSMCEAISWRVRSTSEESAAYTGFRVSFGDAHPPNGKRHAFGYKADLGMVPLDDFVDIAIPFSQFTDYWDDATGDAIVSCEEDSKYCPKMEDLKELKTVAIWAEGVAGKVSVEIDSIHAVQCGPDSS